MITWTLAGVATAVVLGFSGTPAQLPELEHTPGARAYAIAMRDYQNERFFSARSNFLQAAHWADKIAQFNLGVIYYHGQGVPVDRHRAWAWFHLAAERGYPQLVEMAELVWDEFDADGQARARKVLAELLPRYGDEVAVPRTARNMELRRRQATGSRVGFIGALTIYDSDGVSRRGDEYYAADKWDFRTIVQRETELFHRLSTGRVEIGGLEVIREEPEKREDR